MSQTILDNIERHISLNPEEKAYFLSKLEKKVLKKRQFLLHEGEICRHSAFVTNGLLRAYSLDHNGFEHILQFAPEGWWIADMYSLLSEMPAELNIDALEHSELLLLSKEDQMNLYLELPQFERFFRILTENSLVAFRKRVIQSLQLSAKERYEVFCQTYPELIQTLPQKYLAAYIGISPQFLSKIRSTR